MRRCRTLVSNLERMAVRATSHRKEGHLAGKKPERRDVTPNTSGGWDVRKPGAKRASAHEPTQKDAINRGREILGNKGGGELRIKGTDGKVRDQNTVPKGNDPRSSKG